MVRFFGHLRKHFNQAGTFKGVDPATQTPLQVPPRRAPSAKPLAHWMTFKEEQRLDWQQKDLTQLCEADQEIQEASELVTDFTSMLRERQGERLDAWLQKVETQGIGELKNFAEAIKKRRRCSESWPHAGVEQRSRCIMHLVTRISINSIQPAVVAPPGEEKKDRIHDHCSTPQQCAPGDTSAKWFERRRRDVGLVLRRSACPEFASVHTDLQDRGDDAVDRHGYPERGVHQRYDNLADLTAQPPGHRYIH